MRQCCGGGRTVSFLSNKTCILFRGASCTGYATIIVLASKFVCVCVLCVCVCVCLCVGGWLGGWVESYNVFETDK
jgi:hypothetical protein